MPETAKTPQWAKGSRVGTRASFSASAHAYSANEPFAMPKTASPTAKRVTPDPMATTVPATSSPGTGLFGRENPKPITRMRYGRPVIMCQVPRSIPAACTAKTTSPAPGVGTAWVPNERTSVVPYAVCTIARIVFCAATAWVDFGASVIGIVFVIMVGSPGSAHLTS